VQEVLSDITVVDLSREPAGALLRQGVADVVKVGQAV
jgi:hypothetical protein